MARTVKTWLLPFSFFAAACGAGSAAQSPGGGTLVDNGFESDDPSGRSQAGMAKGGTAEGAASGAGGSTPAPATDNGGAQRTVEEADILALDGTRLYTLSRYGGFAVVDVADPDHLRVIGRKRTDGIPFEMYVRNGKAYVMMNQFGRWVRDEGSPYGRWVETSEILTLDASDPAAIKEQAHFDVPGDISDSRLVGDVLYLVTQENGSCYNCNRGPSTIVTSFNTAGAIAQVDQIAYTAPSNTYTWWKRSVSATNQRLYVAGPEWTYNPNTGGSLGSSIIQVIDITDPGGRMSRGADVPVAGQITSRWQMDEDNGVLRVVSQPGNGWSGGPNPRVQTFTIASSSSITPLGQADITIPQPESLRSVRFDGPRAYAITAQQTDPLFTIDVSDPAHPKQAGQLAMPGWIFYMEPRGDRLVGFGWDNTNTSQASMAVSLFDVSDISKPAMLKRVAFGQGWGQFAEDQDRIQKSVRVLDDQGLVLVPFASYGRWSGSSCSQGQSGIQIIDYSHDNLVLRGIAPQFGMPRRALVTGGRLLGISDRSVSTFDIGSRDNPLKTNDVDLANPAYNIVDAGDQIASITNDWWTGEVELSLTPKANADDADVTGKLLLGSLADSQQTYCGAPTAWAAWYQARLFANGKMLYLALPVYTQSGNVYGGNVVVASIDISDPKKPFIAGKAQMPLTSHDTSMGYGYGYYRSNVWFDGYAYYNFYSGMYGALLGSGSAALTVGTKLAYLETDYEYIETKLPNGNSRYDTKVHRNLHTVDFANPAAPTVFGAIDLGDSLGASPLLPFAGTVMTSRWLPSPKNPDKVRFYVDRVDLSGAAPVVLASLNTPGSLLLADEPSKRIATVDYHASKAPAANWQDCQNLLGDRAWFDSEVNSCVRVDRSFALADVAGSRVSLRQVMQPPSQNIAGITTADDRIYLTRYKRYASGGGVVSTNGGYVPPAVIEDAGLFAIGGIRAGQMAVVSQMVGDANWPLAAAGSKVALYTDGGLAIYDTTTPAPTLLKEANLRGWGYTSDILLGDDKAICALGEWGLQTIPLK